MYYLQNIFINIREYFLTPRDCQERVLRLDMRSVPYRTVQLNILTFSVFVKSTNTVKKCTVFVLLSKFCRISSVLFVQVTGTWKIVVGTSVNISTDTFFRYLYWQNYFEFYKLRYLYLYNLFQAVFFLYLYRYLRFFDNILRYLYLYFFIFTLFLRYLYRYFHRYFFTGTGKKYKYRNTYFRLFY